MHTKPIAQEKSSANKKEFAGVDCRWTCHSLVIAPFFWKGRGTIQYYMTVSEYFRSKQIWREKIKTRRQSEMGSLRNEDKNMISPFRLGKKWTSQFVGSFRYLQGQLRRVVEGVGRLDNHSTLFRWWQKCASKYQAGGFRDWADARKILKINIGSSGFYASRKLSFGIRCADLFLRVDGIIESLDQYYFKDFRASAQSAEGTCLIFRSAFCHQRNSVEMIVELLHFDDNVGVSLKVSERAHKLTSLFPQILNGESYFVLHFEGFHFHLPRVLIFSRHIALIRSIPKPS